MSEWPLMLRSTHDRILVKREQELGIDLAHRIQREIGHDLLASADLPSANDLPVPEVRLPRHTLVRFRTNYSALLAFAARKFKIAPQEVTGMHLVADLLRDVNEMVDDDE